MTGTSQATAFVTGVAALVLSENPGLSMAKVKSIIEESVVKSPKLVGKTKDGGYVSAVAALEYAKQLYEAMDSSPEEFRQYIHDETQTWARVIHEQKLEIAH